MWPGYECSIKCFNDGIFLNVDTSTKFVNKESILEKINRLKMQRYSIAQIKEQLITTNPNERRLTVITVYNSHIYQVDDMTLDFNPKNYIFNWTLMEEQPTDPGKSTE